MGIIIGKINAYIWGDMVFKKVFKEKINCVC